MTLLIIPDIFGVTPAITQLAEDLAPTLTHLPVPGKGTGQPVAIVDPYSAPDWAPCSHADAEKLWFDNEDRAYAYFCRNLGIPAYARKIETYLTHLTHLTHLPHLTQIQAQIQTQTQAHAPCLLLAFSAGASAVWHLAATHGCAKSPTPGKILGAVCLYGSQIRHCPYLIPEFNVHLIFPESEPHFDVDDLMAVLAKKPNTTLEKSTGRHGFMNRYSRNFDPDLYKKFIQEDFLSAASRLRF